MRTWLPALSIVAVSALSGCGSTPAQPGTASGQPTVAQVTARTDGQWVCTRERQSGTNIAVTVCRDMTEAANRTTSDRETADRLPTAVPESVRGR